MRQKNRYMSWKKRAVEIIAMEQDKEKRMKRNEDSLRDNIKWDTL